MNPPETTQASIEQCAAASHAGELSFGACVARLSELGVESYFADYRAGQTTYYLPSGATHVVRLPVPGAGVAERFDGDGVREAIRGAQSGAVRYPEFVRRTVACGCAGYFVWIAGRHVRCFGRRGEDHLEPFPSR